MIRLGSIVPRPRDGSLFCEVTINRKLAARAVLTRPNPTPAQIDRAVGEARTWVGNHRQADGLRSGIVAVGRVLPVGVEAFAGWDVQRGQWVASSRLSGILG